MEHNLQEFISAQTNGDIFCKIGKSGPNVSGKGGYYPYIDYVGMTIDIGKNLTFGKLEDILNYLHYGDQLVVFNFNKENKELAEARIRYNLLNKNFYDSSKLHVEKVLPFNQPETIDFIFSNVHRIDIFQNTVSSYYLIASRLKDLKEEFNDPMFDCSRQRLWENINRYYPNIAQKLKNNIYNKFNNDFPELDDPDSRNVSPNVNQSIISRIIEFIKK